MYRNLGEFIDALERAGELERVKTRVDVRLELSEIAQRRPDKALLFEHTGTEFPVLINAYGTDRRMAMALGVGSLKELEGRVQGLIEAAMKPRVRLHDKLAALPLLAQMSRWMPRRVGGGFRRELASLNELPVIRSWPADGGNFITLPLVHTVDPQTGAPNVGMYRMQIFDGRTAGLHWHVHKTGARHYSEYKRLKRRMPVAVALGGDPVYAYAATAPLPDGVDEYLLAGFLRRRPVRLVECQNGLWVPEDCDFVIEGWASEEQVEEGPFGDHTGFYSLTDRYPQLEVSRIVCRENAVFPATVVGIPPQEDAAIARATERLFLPPIRALLQPELEDMTMPDAGVAHNLVVASVHARYAGQAVKVAQGLWGAGQMMFNKYLILTPAGVNVRSFFSVARLLRRASLHFSEGPLDALDHATATPAFGGKLLIDLTGDGPGLRGVRFLLDPAAASLPFADRFWLALANSDPRRDVKVEEGVLVIDACTKKLSRWPNPTVMDPPTIALVDARWAEYRLGAFVESPSLRYRGLMRGIQAEIS